VTDSNTPPKKAGSETSALEKGKKDNTKGRSSMFIPTLIMGVIALVLFTITTIQGDGQNISGLRSAMQMTIQIVPLLIFAFIVAGYVQVLIPKELLSKWVGEESGLRGIIVGTLAGGLTPGGPYVSLPIAAGLLKSGAGMGIMVAFVTSWSLYAVARLPMDIGILGVRFTLIRLISIFIFPRFPASLPIFYQNMWTFEIVSWRRRTILL
jgi:uncharacterized membrane protein YraQ (UPF0718 family)